LRVLKPSCDDAPMRVLIITGAFAERGRGARAHRLACDLAAAGHDVTIVAPEQRDGAAPDGVRVERAGEYPPVVPPRDRLPWVLQMNSSLLARASAVVRARGADVVHAIGWDVAWAAAGVRSAFGIPLVATVPVAEPRDGLTEEHRRVARDAAAWLLLEATPASAKTRGLAPAASAKRAVAAYERAASLGTPRRAPKRAALERPAREAEHFA
jgi:hypothetical protein